MSSSRGGPSEAGRAPLQPRGHRRSGACPGPKGRHAQRGQTDGVDQTHKAYHTCSGGGYPSRGANPSPCRGPHVSTDPSGHSAVRGAGGGRGRPRVGGLPNNDPAVAVSGSLARSRPQGAVRGARAPTLGLAHRASLKGGRPVEGGNPLSANCRRGQGAPISGLASVGRPRPAHRASQRRPTSSRDRSGAPQRQASPCSRVRPSHSLGSPQRGQPARG